MSAATVSNADRLRQMARELLDMAEAIDGDDNSAFMFSRSRPTDTPEMALPRIVQQARSEYQARRDRLTNMPNELFGEPGWDILLDLFIEQAEGRVTPVTSASIASCAPATTALRYLSLLESIRYIEEKQKHKDKRVRLIGLSKLGHESVASYLKRRLQVDTSQQLLSI